MAVVILRSQKGEFRSQKTRRLEVLLMKRPRGGVWEGMWEFPVMSGEWRRLEAGSWKMRAIEQELGMRVGRLSVCGEVVHTLTHRRMVYEVVRGVVAGRGKVKLPACREGGRYEEARWVPWPLVKDRAGLAWARVVEKIAQAAGARAIASEPRWLNNWGLFPESGAAAEDLVLESAKRGDARGGVRVYGQWGRAMRGKMKRKSVRRIWKPAWRRRRRVFEGGEG